LTNQVKRVLKRDLCRTVVPTQRDGYAFAHETLATAGEQRFRESGDLQVFVDYLHTWADEHRTAGWGSGTPIYLLLGYPRMLARESEGDDTGRECNRLFQTVTSEGRWAAVFLRSPAAADQEVKTAQDVMLAAARSGRLSRDELQFRLAVLGLSRGTFRGTITPVADALATVWAATGSVHEAVELAQSILEPDGRAAALSRICIAVLRRRVDGDLPELVPGAVRAIRQAGPYRATLTEELVGDLAAGGAWGEALEVADSHPDSEEALRLRAETARAAARARASSVALDGVEDVLAGIGDDHVTLGPVLLGLMAETVLTTGDTPRAIELLDRADAARKSMAATQDYSDRSWSKLMVDASRWRCRAVDAAHNDDPLTHLRGHGELGLWLDHPEMADARGWWILANIAETLAGCGRPAAADRVARAALQGSVASAGHHDDVGRLSLKPHDLAGVLLRSGITAPVQDWLRVVDEDSGEGRVSSAWTSAAATVRVRLRHALAAAGHLQEATDGSDQSPSDWRNTSPEVLAAAATARADAPSSSPPLSEVRQLLEHRLREAVARDRSDRFRTARWAASHALTSGTVQRRSTPARSRSTEANDVAIARLEHHTKRLQTASGFERLPILAETCSALLSVARIDDSAAGQATDALLTEVSADDPHIWSVDFVNWIDAAGDVARTLAMLNRRADVDALLELMLARLTKSTEAQSGFESVRLVLSTAIDVGALNQRRAGRFAQHIRDRAGSTPGDGVRVAPELARAVQAGMRSLAPVAVDLLVAAQPPSDSFFPRDWADPALAVLDALQTERCNKEAARLAGAILAFASDPSMLWHPRAEILGRLVSIGEADSVDEALERLTMEDGFADHFGELPVPLLERIATSGVLEDDGGSLVEPGLS
jgi:hypothetical protein